ncbi:MAG: PilN domain-containing protein [Nitrospiraceae bacterium]|nr:PilN domain-containing protein [Nitrospiraceae bacterium]
MKKTLNLLPLAAKAGGTKGRGLSDYLIIGICVYAAVIMSLWVSRTIEYKKLVSENNLLAKKKIELQGKIAPVSTTGVPASYAQEIINAIEQSQKWSLIISDISVVTPEDVWLSSIETRIDGGAKLMNIKGFSTSQLAVANFISALEASNHFYNVEIVFSQKGEKNISFELKTKLKWV